MRRAARPEGDQRRIGRRARARRGASRERTGRSGARRDPRQPGHRREEPSAHFDGTQDQQVRRAARRGARAVRGARRRAARCSSSPFTSTSARRSRRIEPLRSAAARRRRPGAGLRRRRDRRSNTWIWAAASASPTTAGRRCRPTEYASALVDEVRPTGLPIVVEPGRSIVGPAGVLVARVVDLKPRNASSEFAVIDAGMTELMRPALYGAFHRIEPVRPRAGARAQYEIVGPVCESSDVVGRDRDAAAARGRRPAGHSRRRRVRVGDGVELQPPAAAGRGARRRAAALARRPPPADDRRHAWTSRNAKRLTRRLSSHLHLTHVRPPDRLRRARSERQADAGRAAARSAEAGGPEGAPGVVSRLRARRSARRSRGRCRASASTGPTSCSCSTSRTATSESPTCSAGSTAG